MAVFDLDQTNDNLRQQYHGCGNGWAALNEYGEIVAIRYEAPLTAAEGQVRDWQGTCLRELSQQGRVVVGQFSCWQFITAALHSARPADD